MKEFSDFKYGEHPPFITDIVFKSWGYEVCLQCKNEFDGDVVCEICFLNCEKIELFLNSPENRHEMEADVIFWDLGSKDGKRPASIHRVSSSNLVANVPDKYEKM